VAEHIDTLILARWTLSMCSPVRAETEYAVALDKGRIVAVLPAHAAAARFEARVTHVRPNHIALPGLINAHCHAGMTLLRGVADDLPLDAWLKDSIWPLESQWVNRDFVADGTRLAIAEMLLGGITCFADMYYFPDVVAAVAGECGMRASVGMIALEFPTIWAQTVDEYISKGLEVHDRYQGDPLITTAFAPHAPYTVSDETLRRIRQLADELEVPVHTHLHETAEEIQRSVADCGMRPLARLQSLGLVTPALSAVHATQLIDAEIMTLAEANASVVHCPRSNMKLASGNCRVHDLRAAGVNVAVGTDGAASNNRLDILAELQLAALLGKQVAEDASALPAAQALELATTNGAIALGLEKEIGQLAAGKAADVICIDLDGPGQIPIHDPISALVYSASREQVSDVWIAGEHLVEARRLTRMNVGEVLLAAEEWGGRIQGSQ
jgi:5-methylthioadenosine/S-adenosylhomocysteine deaminase